MTEKVDKTADKVQEELRTRVQAAGYLGLKPQTLAAWAVRNVAGPPFIKFGRSVRYRQSDLDKWIESRVVCPGQ